MQITENDLPITTFNTCLREIGSTYTYIIDTGLTSTFTTHFLTPAISLVSANNASQSNTISLMYTVRTNSIRLLVKLLIHSCTLLPQSHCRIFFNIHHKSTMVVTGALHNTMFISSAIVSSLNYRNIRNIITKQVPCEQKKINCSIIVCFSLIHA